MPNQNEIKTTINIDANITNVERAVGEIRKQMGQLQLGKGMQTGLAELYANFEQNFKRMRELTEGGKLKLVDEKEFSKTAANISNLWDKLMKQVSAAGVDVKPLAKYQSALNNLNAQSKAYQKETKQAANDLAKAQQKQADLEQNLVEAQKKAKALTEEKIKKAKAVAEALKKQEEHQEAINKAEKEGLKNTSGKGYDRRYNTGRDANEAAAQLPQDAADIERLKNEYQDIVGEIEKQAQAVNRTNAAISDQKREVKEVQNAYDKIANEAIVKVVQELQKIEGIDWSGIGVDLNSIKTWDELKATIEDLNNRGLTEAADAMSKVTVAADQGTSEMDGFRRKTGEVSDELHHLSETGKEIDNLTNRIKNFFSIGNAAMLFRRAIRSAYNEIKELDKAMTETAVVTNMTVGDLWKMLPQYTKRANELGVSIQSVYEADTLYYQQGLKTNEVMAVSNETMKMARIAGLDAAEATDRMTNALRGFNMEITTANSQNINDVYSQLAARTASNVDEISTAMTKVASLAHSANMEFENTAAFLAQIIETTRESAETAGTALKTVVARFSEVKNLYSKDQLMGTDEEGQEIDVNKVSTALRSAGINLNEYLTGAKGLDQIFMELSAKWDSLDIVQQRYIATMAAGSRQQSRFIALMQDYNRMTELTTLANNAAGASNEQFQKTQESLESMLNRLKNAWTEFLFGLVNTDAVKGVIKILTDLLNTINNLTNGFGPASKSVLKFFAAFGTFKVGKSLFNKLFEGLSRQFVNAGKQAATSYETGLVGGIKKIKSVFTKDFWVGLGTGNTKIIQDNVKALSALEEVSKTAADGTNLAAASQLVMEESLKALNLENAEYLKLKASGLSIQQQAILLDGSEQSATALNLILTKGMEDAETKEAVAKALENKETKQGIFYKLAENAQRLASVLGIQVENTVIYQKIFAKKVENKVLEKNIALQWASLGVIGLIIAALVILVGVIIAVSVALANNTPEKQQERLAEATKQAAEAAKNAADNYKQLNDSIENLDNKQQELKKLVKGTDEWSEKVKEVNTAVKELKENYRGLELEYDENTGLLTINKESLDKTQKEAESGKRNSEIAAAYKDIEESLGELKTLFATDENLFLYRVNYDLDASGTKTNLQQTQLSTSDTIDMIKQAYQQFLLTPSPEENFMQSYLNNLDGFDFYYNDIAGLGQVTNDELKYYYDKITSLESTIDSANASYMAVIQSNLDLSSYGEETKSLYQRYVSTLGDLNQSSIDAIQKLDNQTKSKYSVSSTFAGNEAIGLKSYEQYYKEIYGADFDKIGDWGEVKLKNGKNSVKAEDARKQYLQYKTYIEQQQNFFELESKLQKENSDAVKKLISGQSLTQSELSQVNNEDIISSIVESYGLDAEHVRKWIATEQQKFKQSEEILSTIYTGIPKFISDNSAEIQNGLTKNLLEIFKVGGSEGVQQATAAIESYADGLSDKTREIFLQALAESDFSASSLNKLKESMIDAGAAATELEDGEFNGLIQQLKNLAKISASINLKEQLADLLDTHKVLQEIGTEGKKAFSQEEYNKLIGMSGVNSEQFIYNLETGTYDYTGPLRDLQHALEQNTAALLQTNNLQESVDAGKIVTDLYNEYGKFSSDQDLIEAFQASDQTLWSKDYIEFILQDEQRTKEAAELLMGYKTNLKTNEELLSNANRAELAAWYQTQNATLVSMSAISGDRVAQDSLKAMAGNVGMTPEEIEAYADDWIALGHAIEEYQRLADYKTETENLASYSEQLQQTLNLSAKQANAVAAANSNLNAGYQKLVENFDTWNEVIEKGDKNSAEYAKTIDDLQEYLAQMIGVTKTELPQSFIRDAKTLDLLTLAANGNLNAIEELVAGFSTEKILMANNAKELSDEVDLALEEIGSGGYTIGQNIESNILTELFNAYQKILTEAGYFGDELDRKLREIFSSMRVGVSWTEVANKDGSVSFELPEFIYNGSAVTAINQSTLNKARSKAETHNWLTSLDKYYNFTAAINEQLRQREKYERQYDRMLKRREGTYEDMKKAILGEQATLRRELDLQSQLYEHRKEQIKDAANEKIQWGEGYSTYAAIGADKYASWDEENHQVVINWDAIHAITNEDLGQAVEAYISKLEEYEGELEEIEKNQEDVRDALYEANQRGKEEYLELQERITEALIKQRQLEIDELQGISDQISTINSDIVSGIQEQIELERQIRDNTKKEEELNDMEQRLAYLQRDTSGANAVAIKELEENLENARQEYTDSLIDQTIQQMQDDNEKAQEQREKQIDLMQKQLDWDQIHGKFQEPMYELLKKVYGPNGEVNKDSGLMNLLKTTDAFKYLTEEAQMNWLKDMLEEIKAATEGEGNFELEKAIHNNNGVLAAEKNSLNKALTWDSNLLAWRDEETGKYYNHTWNQYTKKFDMTEQNNGPVITPNSVGGTASSGGSSPVGSGSGAKVPKSYDIVDPNGKIVESFGVDEKDKAEETLKILQGVATNAPNYKNYDDIMKYIDMARNHRHNYERENLKAKLTANKVQTSRWVDDATDKINENAVAILKQGYAQSLLNKNSKLVERYLSGGLNTSTGPAWLDGTTSRPEYVLNARDTQVYLTLTSLLNKLLSNSQSVSSDDSNGDNYFDININVEGIGSDYDVDQMIERVKETIVQDAQYRNVNVINLRR